MGVTIHYKIAQKVKYVKKNIDELENVAKAIKREQADKLGIAFTIRRESPHSIYIDIGQCETLAFVFKTMDDHLKEERYYNPFEDLMAFEKSHQTEHYQTWPDQKLLWSSDFCKTQFAHNAIQHKWVADLVRLMASRSSLATISDEGDYAHTGEIEDAKGAIHENGQLINSLTGMLGGMGYEVVQNNSTTIKPRKAKK